MPESVSYSDDLVQVVTNSCITYSYLTTQNLYILHPYRRKSIRKDTSELRYCCALNTTYQSSSRKTTYYFNSRITRFSWLSTFRQRMRENMLLLYISRVQRAVVLELRIITYFVRFSDPKKACLKYADFSTTYQFSYQKRQPTISNQGNQRIQRYTEHTLRQRKIEMVNASLLVQQFTHPVHPNSSYHLPYLLRQFVDKTGEKHNRKRTKHKKNTSKAVSLFQKSNDVNMTGPNQTACSARSPKLSSLAAVASP